MASAVLRLPAPAGRLAWWVRHPGGTAHLAVWRPTGAPGRWHWMLLCPQGKAGHWWEAQGEPRCRRCLRLIEKAKARNDGTGAGWDRASSRAAAPLPYLAYPTQEHEILVE